MEKINQQKSMVTIPLFEYNELLKLKEAFDSSDTVVIRSRHGVYDKIIHQTDASHLKYLTDMLVSIGRSLVLLETEIDKVKNMSILQFKQWKKQSRT